MRPGMLGFEFWNCAWVDAVGPVVSTPPLWRFGGMPLEALGRSRVFPAPGLAGDGGGGCAAFKRSAVTPGRWLARTCCE